jgi:CHAT domain-containing protein
LSPEEQKLAAEAERLNGEAGQLYRDGKAAEAVPLLRKSLDLRRKLFPASKFPDGHSELATGLNNLGFMLQAAGSAEKALPFYEQGLAMYRKLYPASRFPEGHADLASSLNNMGAVLHALGSTERALPFYDQALAMNRQLYPTSEFPDGHPSIALSLNNMGFVLQAAGSAEKALSCYEQALAMTRALYPESKYPDGHLDLARNLNNLATLLEESGQAEKAIPLSEQALAMRRKLYPATRYPDGHPDVARSLNNLSAVLRSAGAAKKALPLQEQALAMNRAIYPVSMYPDGHPDLALSLNNMGTVLEAAGSADKAVPFYEEALAMYRTLYPASKYPDGHPDLAESLNNLGYALDAVGSVEKATTLFEQSLSMHRKLYPASRYPNGHPDLARSLNNMGAVLYAAGSAEKALPLCEQALAMHRRLAQQLLLTSSEDGALAYLQAQPRTRDGYLSAASRLPGTEAAAYRAVWPSKAALSRVLELRHAAARAAGPEAVEGLVRLKENRRRTAQLLQDDQRPPEERDRELAGLADQRDVMERRLAKDLPILARWTEREKQTPEDLAKTLPAGAAFVDLLAWIRIEQDPRVKGKPGEKPTLWYLAFVVAAGREVRRIDLGPAEPIDQAIHSWRRAIERGTAGDAAERLRVLVWENIAKHLPPGTRMLYLAADGDLARLPWAALPIGRDRVLLEDFALAVVPHGSFLLEQLQDSSTSRPGLAKESVLTLGDVAYNSATWSALPGTRIEIDSIATRAPSPPVVLTAAEATVSKLVELLPKARYAHLATHGEFQADAFTAEQQRLRAARREWEEGRSQEARRVPAKNPLAYVGLVLANGERLSGLSILDLDLSRLKLVTLSACETGLGEYTGGKGVENLQQAFHLAGCPNVVASLWKVNDAATAALMTKFYHELWVNKKPPIEALREAQLTIYRRPDLISTLASGERGIRLEQALHDKTTPTAAERKTTPTKLWAAFVLSGVGQ